MQVMRQFSPAQRSADQMLLERIQQLHDLRGDQPIQSREYKRLSGEIRDLSALWQAHRGEAVRTARPKH